MLSSRPATKVQVDSQISEIQLSSEEEEEEEEEKSPGFKSGPKDYQADIKSKSCSRTTHNTGTHLPPLSHPLLPLPPLQVSMEPHGFTFHGFRSNGLRSLTYSSICSQNPFDLLAQHVKTLSNNNFENF